MSLAPSLRCHSLHPDSNGSTTQLTWKALDHGLQVDLSAENDRGFRGSMAQVTPMLVVNMDPTMVCAWLKPSTLVCAIYIYSETTVQFLAFCLVLHTSFLTKPFDPVHLAEFASRPPHHLNWLCSGYQTLQVFRLACLASNKQGRK